MKKALGAILASSLVLTAAALPAAAQESRAQMRDRQDMTSQDMREQRTRTRASAAQRADSKAVSAAERQLRDNGHQVGRIDGRVDAATLNATANFQLEHGLPPTGLLDLQTLAALGIDLEPTNQIGQVPQQ